MADRQIRELPPQEMPLAQRVRPRSLTSQISAALLQPVYFFRTLPTMGETRQWLWVGLLILLLIGFSAVRQEALTATNTGIDGPSIDFGGGFGAPVDGGDFGGAPIDGGAIPPDFGGGVPVDGGGTGTGANVTATLTTGIIAASGIFVGWIILTLLLSEVSLLRGRAPRLGQNFQIAVWSSLPLALMAFLQILYYAAGGAVGAPGVSRLLERWDGYAAQSPFVRSLLLSLASTLTIFWLWKLMMLYFGARFALNGRRWAAMLVVISWIVVSIVTPVLTGAIEAPDLTDTTEPLPDFGSEVPFDDPEFPDGDEGAFDPFASDTGIPFDSESTGEAPVNGSSDFRSDSSIEGEDFSDEPSVDNGSVDGEIPARPEEFDVQSTEEAEIITEP
jgi:hypothetical protein